jgi:hypothetical protein
VVNFIISKVRCDDMKCREMKLHLFKQNYVLSNRTINAYVPPPTTLEKVREVNRIQFGELSTLYISPRLRCLICYSDGISRENLASLCTENGIVLFAIQLCVWERDAADEIQAKYVLSGKLYGGLRMKIISHIIYRKVPKNRTPILFLI